MTVWSMGDNSPNSQTIANIELSNTFYANLVLIYKCYWKTIQSYWSFSFEESRSSCKLYEDLWEDETTLYFSHSYLLNMA